MRGTGLTTQTMDSAASWLTVVNLVDLVHPAQFDSF